MDLQERFLQALRASRPAYDEAPDWRAGLALFDSLTPAEVAEMDRLLPRMVDEEYRNPHSSHENLPFDDVMVNLPAGMTPEDLLCIEAAALVAAERGIGQGFFALNRLMRAPRWHAMFPRLYWLNYEGFEAQRRLGMTRAGRGLGALVGAAIGAQLTRAQGEAPSALGEAMSKAIAQGSVLPAGASAEAGAFQAMVDALLDGSSKAVALEAGGLRDQQSSPGAGALAVAAECFLNAQSLEECLNQAVAHGAEVAQVAGALAGAYWGPLAAPRRWTSELTGRAQLEAAAESLYNQYLDMR